MPKPKPNTPPQQPPPIQFRPGPLLGRRIAEFASAWRVTENEAAKRLTAVTAYRLDPAWYPLLVQLAEAMRPPVGGVADFPAACDRIRAVIDGANRARQDLGNESLNEAETTAFVKRTVDEVVRAKQFQQPKQVQTVKVFRTPTPPQGGQ